MSDLKASLLRIMDQKDHWAWSIFGGSTATRDQLRLHFQQEYAVYVRDFPMLVSRIHSRCPVPDVRRDLAENLYEEETGGLSGTGPHPELFLYMMEGLGFSKSDFRAVKLLPESQAYREWLDEATTQMPWVVGAAVVTIFVEGSVHDRREISQQGPRSAEDEALEDDLLMDNPLVKYHGLDPRYLKLKRAHARVEHGHRRAAWRIVLEHATSGGDRMLCIEALERSLELWLAYRDGVARAAGVAKETRRAARRAGRAGRSS
ncbi:MAG TPA: iron-containing redox enzyme family protein [Candidatus Polarisedimenticolia bacterium]|nr:iron-containing redox enzyme family protein [Candidatus Polarisedimenticolia bacterium]